tara:strand:+ start:304 stop:498 length:195 start_codon:yes stop_codon:yes gene_type:complete
MIKTLEELSNWITLEAKVTTELQVQAQQAFWNHPTKDLGRVFWVVCGGFEDVDWNAILTNSITR